METYSVLVLSTAHITKDDADLWNSITHNHPHTLEHPDRGMIMERDTGFFLKLYQGLEFNGNESYSDALIKIITYAHEEGHRMIEFDCDGPEYPEQFEIFKW